uniref:Uncharacterized protein n=1 Tax=Nelumbo nucifera TaxID=4432 RepID=A0A822ZCU6_NELNU|nr:TPA_asm: hypothetical protein HUJ06_015568 [Nelumbo nucifera]
MEQSFFQAVLSRGKWKGPHDLARMVLYDSLVKPMLDLHRRRATKSFLGFFRCKKSGLAEEAPTLLHALWLTLVGPDLSDGVVKEDDKAGISFRNNKGVGIRGIKFKTKWLKFDAYLCLRELYQDRSGGEVCAYLKFTSELVRSHEDAKVLAIHGVIDVDTASVKNLHNTLVNLHLPEEVNDHSLSVIVNLIIITLLLTLVQTIYTAVGYHHPKN